MAQHGGGETLVLLLPLPPAPVVELLVCTASPAKAVNASSTAAALVRRKVTTRTVSFLRTCRHVEFLDQLLDLFKQGVRCGDNGSRAPQKGARRRRSLLCQNTTFDDTADFRILSRLCNQGGASPQMHMARSWAVVRSSRILPPTGGSVAGR